MRSEWPVPEVQPGEGTRYQEFSDLYGYFLERLHRTLIFGEPFSPIIKR
jgi:hypothetical protein